MGVNHTAQVLYSLSHLERGDVADILHGLARERDMEIPTVDVDCSNVCFKVGKSVECLASFLMRWAQAGLRIVPICDGKVRPISKQATNKRQADQDKNCIKAFIFRKDLQELHRQVYCNVNYRQEIMKEIAIKGL